MYTTLGHGNRPTIYILNVITKVRGHVVPRAQVLKDKTIRDYSVHSKGVVGTSGLRSTHTVLVGGSRDLLQGYI